MGTRIDDIESRMKSKSKEYSFHDERWINFIDKKDEQEREKKRERRDNIRFYVTTVFSIVAIIISIIAILKG